MNKVKLNRKWVNLSLLLVGVFVLILVWEAYLLYSLFYTKLFGQDTDLITGRIVRLDLNSYNHTLQLLDSDKNFTPQPLNLPNSNPFK